MIKYDIPFGQVLISDADFGHVSSGDDSFAKRFENSEGWSPDRMVWMDQIHSHHLDYVDVVGSSIQVFPETDGLWTDQKDCMLITRTADCVPILLWSEAYAIIAALHCGWQGFFSGIIESFVQQMSEKGLDIRHFSAFLGPHLRMKNFELQKEFVSRIPEEKKKFLLEQHGKLYYDMTSAIMMTLGRFNLNDVEDCGDNTYGNSNYFSYRSWTRIPEAERTEKYSTFANCIVMRI